MLHIDIMSRWLDGMVVREILLAVVVVFDLPVVIFILLVSSPDSGLMINFF